MRSSRWHALGNTYLLVGPDERRLTPGAVRELSRDADGVVEVLEAGETTADVVIRNRDGSTAELSGNGTRIAARWLAERSGAGELVVRVGRRHVSARVLETGEVETNVGPVEVALPEFVEGVQLTRVSVANPHAVVEADPAEIVRLGPLLVAHPSFPGGTNVEVARVEREGEVLARVWERGVGETHRPREPARSPSQPPRTATARSSCCFPEERSTSASRAARRSSPGPPRRFAESAAHFQRRRSRRDFARRGSGKASSPPPKPGFAREAQRGRAR